MNDIEQSVDVRVEPRTKTTIFGKIRTIADLDKWERAFLIISGLTLVVTLALTVVTITMVTNSFDRTLAVILLVHTMFCVFYVFDGVFRERPYELVIYVISACVVLCYLLLNFFTTYATSVDNPVKKARLVCAAVFMPPNVALGIYLTHVYTDTGNLIFRTVGAQSVLQSACRTLFLFEGVLKFDFHISLLLLMLVHFDALTTLGIIFLAVGIPFVIGWLACGFFAAVFERPEAMYAFWATCYFETAYVGYQLYFAVIQLQSSLQQTTVQPIVTSESWFSSSSTSQPITSTAPPSSLPFYFVIFVLAAISIFVRVLLIIISVLVYRNFGKGLKQRIKFGWQVPEQEQNDSVDSKEQERRSLLSQPILRYTGV